jgi:hypothetical protein
VIFSGLPDWVGRRVRGFPQPFRSNCSPRLALRPHEPEAYAAGERYFPDDIEEQNWSQPTPRGLEGKIADKLAHLKKLDEAAGKV